MSENSWVLSRGQEPEIIIMQVISKRFASWLSENEILQPRKNFKLSIYL